MVARRVDQFINIPIKGASGTLDPADIHCKTRSARPGSERPDAGRKHVP